METESWICLSKGCKDTQGCQKTLTLGLVLLHTLTRTLHFDAGAVVPPHLRFTQVCRQWSASVVSWQWDLSALRSLDSCYSWDARVKLKLKHSFVTRLSSIPSCGQSSLRGTDAHPPNLVDLRVTTPSQTCQPCDPLPKCPGLVLLLWVVCVLLLPHSRTTDAQSFGGDCCSCCWRLINYSSN